MTSQNARALLLSTLLCGVAHAQGTKDPCPAPAGANGTSVTPAASSKGYFTTSGTNIMDPSGKPFQARGVNMYVEQLANAVPDSQASALLSPSGGFPGTNIIRVNVFDTSADTAATLQVYIATLSALGIIMEIEYHPYSSTLSGSGLASVAQWYGNVAAANAGNPYVIFGTQNEPPSDPNEEIRTIVSAIRGAGNNTLILINPRGGTDTSGINLSGMTNVAWDLHYYNWIAHNSTNLADNQAALATLIANARNTANIPVVIGEYGWACCKGIDPGWQAVVQAVDSTNSIGSAAWAWTSGGSLPLLLNDSGGNPSQGLTQFGQMVAQYTVKSGATGQGSYDGASFAQQSCVLSQVLYPNAATNVPIAAANQSPPPDPATAPAQPVQVPQVSSPSVQATAATQPAMAPIAIGSSSSSFAPPSVAGTSVAQLRHEARLSHYADMLARIKADANSTQAQIDASPASDGATTDTAADPTDPTTTDTQPPEDAPHHRWHHHHHHETAAQ